MAKHKENWLWNNISWLFDYFEESKWLFEILGLFIVVQAFLYSLNLNNFKEFTEVEVSALKIVFWVLVFVVSLLLYVKTDIAWSKEDDSIMESVFYGPRVSKYAARLLLFTLLAVTTKIFWSQLISSIQNDYFFYFWFGIIMLLFFEILRYLISPIFKK